MLILPWNSFPFFSKGFPEVVHAHARCAELPRKYGQQHITWWDSESLSAWKMRAGTDNIIALPRSSCLYLLGSGCLFGGPEVVQVLVRDLEKKNSPGNNIRSTGQKVKINIPCTSTCMPLKNSLIGHDGYQYQITHVLSHYHIVLCCETQIIHLLSEKKRLSICKCDASTHVSGCLPPVLHPTFGRRIPRTQACRHARRRKASFHASPPTHFPLSFLDFSRFLIFPPHVVTQCVNAFHAAFYVCAYL